MRVAKILLFFIFLSGAISLRAQTNFLKGYYISMNKDTIRGYIENRSEDRNSNLCVFKETLTSKVMELYPQDILGFTIEDRDFYEKHLFNRKNGAQVNGFLRVIIRGRLSLLSYQSMYFVKDSSGQIFEISEDIVLWVTDDNLNLKEDSYGLAILKDLMKDCSELSGDLGEREFQSKLNLTNLFIKYNTCVGSSIIKGEKMRVKPHADFGLLGSSTLSQLTYSSTLGTVSFDNDLSLSLGVFTSFFFPKLTEKFRVVSEVTYSSFSNYHYFATGTTSNDLFVDYSSLKIPLFFRYNFKQVFFDLGVQNQFVINQDLRWRVETVRQNIVYTEQIPEAPLKSFTSGYLVGVGANLKVVNHTLGSSFRFSNLKNLNNNDQTVLRNFELILFFQF